MLTVGLVVEGAHDYIILESLIAHELSAHGHQAISFKRLQPGADAIGNVESGGWMRVKAWCERYAGAQIETFFTPLFNSDPPCDVIIVQMDGDTLELAKIPSPEPPVSVQDRVAAIVAAIENWLALEAHRTAQVAFAVPVLQTEAWALGAEGIQFEHADAKAEFRRTRARNTGSLSTFYHDRIAGARAGFARICDHCESYAAFQGSLARLALPG